MLFTKKNKNEESEITNEELVEMKEMVRENNKILKNEANSKRNTFYLKIVGFIIIIGVGYYLYINNIEELNSFKEEVLEIIDRAKEILDTLGVLEE